VLKFVCVWKKKMKKSEPKEKKVNCTKHCEENFFFF
jgi:hypothetical protein